jgi:hypothetical protein
MFRQVSAPNSLKPPPQQFFGVLDTDVEDGIGRVLQTFATQSPHGEREVTAAIRKAFAFEAKAKTQRIRTRVESLKRDFSSGVHINALVDLESRGSSPNRYSNSIKL